jgi:hypothetical protein
LIILLDLGRPSKSIERHIKLEDELAVLVMTVSNILEFALEEDSQAGVHTGTYQDSGVEVHIDTYNTVTKSFDN